MKIIHLANQLPDWLPDWLPQTLSKKLVAGNDGWQLTQFFLSLLLLWLSARIAKAWLGKLASKAGGEESVPTDLR